MKRIYNFSAGPSMMFDAVLEKAAAEMLDYRGSGMSVMEMSHRSKVYEEIIQRCESDLRELMKIPDDYAVLFLQGGASLQFAATALNLTTEKKKADYVITGQFSKKAYQEGKKYTEAHLVASSEDRNNTYIPHLTKADFSPDADYVHICLNNTIYGTKWHEIPETPSPLIADISSCILSEPIDVSKFGLLYAGAQKNIGPAGLTVVIVNKELIKDSPSVCPTMLSYRVMAENSSMYNTPPCYAIYMAGLVVRYILDTFGSLESMGEHNRKKAAILYDYLDSQDFFKNPNDKEARSIMNVTFVTGNAELDALFCKEAAAEGFVNLKGHRSVGGMRASIYNAMPIEGVEKLVAFMKAFAAAHKED